jgi:hypothetical protein
MYVLNHWPMSLCTLDFVRIKFREFNLCYSNRWYDCRPGSALTLMVVLRDHVEIVKLSFDCKYETKWVWREILAKERSEVCACLWVWVGGCLTMWLQYRDYTAPDVRMIDELERIWKEAIVTWLRDYVRICLEGLRKIRNASSRIALVTAEIRTEDILNVYLEHHILTNLFDMVINLFWKT